MKPKSIYPSYKIFKEQWKTYSIFPFILNFPCKIKDLYPAFYELTKKNKSTFFLDGSERYSFFPLEEPKKHFQTQSFSNGKKVWQSLAETFNSNRGPTLPSNYPPFYGGAVGLLSYDTARLFEKGWKTSPPPDTLRLPLLDFYIYDNLACYDHKNQEIFIISCFRKKKYLDPSLNLYNEQIKRVKDSSIFLFSTRPDSYRDKNFSWPSNSPWLTPRLRQAKAEELYRKIFAHRRSDENKNIELSLTLHNLKDPYIKSLHQIKKYIAQGDIYQANLSQRIEWKSPLTAEQFYGNLRKINPSPYSCFWKTPNYMLASCSPELLLKKRGGFVETRPIAGTRPRGKDINLDKILEGELLLNEKERAEHIMLVDLERNDLGRVCTAGSVRVKKNMTTEKYSHVMHIVSYVEGQLKKSCSFFDAMEALFPGGTITGCPKIRCMEILDELEPVRRGIFYGSLGWIGYQGDGEMNILIRTAVLKKGKITIQVGSGIVADSNPNLEFQESLDKAKALIEAGNPNLT